MPMEIQGKMLLRILAAFGIIIFLVLSSISLVAAEPRQIGALQHFVSIPDGLGAEGLVIRDGHFYVSTISFTGNDGTIFVFNTDGVMIDRIVVPGLPLVGQLAFRDNDTLYAVAG